MRSCVHLTAAAVALVASLPVMDGSFLVRGLVPGARSPIPTLGRSDVPLPPLAGVKRESPRIAPFRCPMVTVDADPSLDPALAKPAQTGIQFPIDVAPPPCTSR